jgi:hypothetical protein
VSWHLSTPLSADPLQYHLEFKAQYQSVFLFLVVLGFELRDLCC